MLLKIAKPEHCPVSYNEDMALCVCIISIHVCNSLEYLYVLQLGNQENET
jgi:hypothetical protein